MLTEKAYAKINLYLEITGKREDGYHTLRMLNQTISLADTLTLSPSRGGLRLICDDPHLPTDDTNLVMRAAKAYLAAAGLPEEGLTIKLEKVIPQKAGLGGGSGDAAAALRLLNRHFDGRLSEEILFAIASDLGADVPFALLGGTAEAAGKGECLTSLPLWEKGAFVIAKPAVGVSTKAAFAAFDNNQRESKGDYDTARQALLAGDLPLLGRSLYNHFEALTHVTEIAQLKVLLLSKGALGVCMSGSGSAVFGLFADEAAAKRAKKALEGTTDFLAVALPCSGRND